MAIPNSWGYRDNHWDKVYCTCRKSHSWPTHSPNALFHKIYHVSHSINGRNPKKSMLFPTLVFHATYFWMLFIVKIDNSTWFTTYKLVKISNLKLMSNLFMSVTNTYRLIHSWTYKLYHDLSVWSVPERTVIPNFCNQTLCPLSILLPYLHFSMFRLFLSLGPFDFINHKRNKFLNDMMKSFFSPNFGYHLSQHSNLDSEIYF